MRLGWAGPPLRIRRRSRGPVFEKLSFTCLCQHMFACVEPLVRSQAFALHTRLALIWWRRKPAPGRVR